MFVFANENPSARKEKKINQKFVDVVNSRNSVSSNLFSKYKPKFHKDSIIIKIRLIL